MAAISLLNHSAFTCLVCLFVCLFVSILGAIQGNALQAESEERMGPPW